MQLRQLVSATVKWSQPGHARDLTEMAGNNTRLLDLVDTHVVPGFIETHMHPMSAGLATESVTVSTPPHRSISDVLDAIRAHASTLSIRRRQSRRGVTTTPVLRRTDTSLPPIWIQPPRTTFYLFSTSPDISPMSTTRVLTESGITSDSPDPQGGRIHRTPTGQPTGLLEEPGAMNLARRAVPAHGYDAFRRGAAAASLLAAQTGTTTMTDMAVWDWEMFRAYQDAIDANELRVRIRVAPYVDFLDQMPFRTGFGDDRLRIGPIKMMADGSIQGYTACLSRPYHDRPEASGLSPTGPDELQARVAEAHDRGFQVAIHANGDEAIDSALDAIEKAVSHSPRADHRHRIEHFQTARPGQIQRAAALGVTVSLFVNHVWFWGDRHHERFLGPDRANRLNPVREVAEAGIPFGLHCDAPVTPLNPLFTMWCAVNRVTSGGRPLGVDQSVDTATAMRGYTTDAAWLSFDEASLGGLSPGHLADFVVLDRNPFTTDPALLRDIEVLRTVVGGETVFET